MKALIPAAGVGVRLRPHTHTKPKPLISVAGKPIIGHILDNLKGCVHDIVIVVGYMKEKLIAYLRRNYGDTFHFDFVEQTTRLGLGHAVLTGLGAVGDEPVLITLGDEFFGMDYSDMMTIHNDLQPRDGTLGIKIVDKPQNYGIVELNDGMIVRLIEKPSLDQAISNLAIAGVYLIENTDLLHECLKTVVGSATPGQEYQLTDALQLMVDNSGILRSFRIDNWYDCGRPEMLLHVNRVLLDKLGSEKNGRFHQSVFIDPVTIEEGCEIHHSIIGPYVSIAAGTKIESSIIKNSIVGSDSAIAGMFLMESIIGDEVTLSGRGNRLNIGENTEIRM